MKKVAYIIKNDGLMALYKGKHISLNKSDSRFKIAVKLINNKNINGLVDFLFPITKAVAYTDNAFVVRNNKVYINGDKTPIHKHISKKLISFYKNNLPYQPLIKFWNNLKANPSKNSVNQLFGCLEQNHHAITDEGFFLAYKYVKKTSNGGFVDSYTGKFDNNIGAKPHMDRSDVVDDPNITCAKGLHVASFEYANSGVNDDNILLEVLVNPADVVSVPKDYNNQKMRVTDYMVVGIGKSEYKGDFISQDMIIKKMKSSIKKNTGFSFLNMTAKQIIKVVKMVIGIKMTYNEKSKKSIVRKAEELFIKKGYMKSNQAIDIHNMTAKQIVVFIKGLTGETITGSIKSKKTIIKKAEKILVEKELV
jgi:hypothetical protein